MYTHQFKINICPDFQKAIQEQNISEVKKFLKIYANWDGKLFTSLAAAIELREVVYAPETLKPEVKDILIKHSPSPLKLLFIDSIEKPSNHYPKNEKVFLDLIELLIANGADVNNTGQENQAPLALAIKPHMDQICKFSHEANKLTKNLVKYLLSQGAYPNALIQTSTHGPKQSCSSFVSEPSNGIWFLLDDFLLYQIDMTAEHKSLGSKQMLLETIKSTSADPITKYLNMKQIAAMHKSSFTSLKSKITLIESALQSLVILYPEDQDTKEMICHIKKLIENVENLASSGLSKEERLNDVKNILCDISAKIDSQESERKELIQKNILQIKNFKNSSSQNQIPDIEKIFSDLTISNVCNKKIPSIDHLRNILGTNCNQGLLKTWCMMQKNLSILKQLGILHNNLEPICQEIKWLHHTWHKEFMDLFFKTSLGFQRLANTIDEFKDAYASLDQDYGSSITECEKNLIQIGEDSDSASYKSADEIES